MHAITLLVALSLLGVDRAAAPPVVRCCDCCTCEAGQCRCAWAGQCIYDAAASVSRLDRKPLVVFVGLPLREVDGARAVSVPEFPGVRGCGVVIGLPDAAGGFDRYDLPLFAEPSTFLRSPPKPQPCRD